MSILRPLKYILAFLLPMLAWVSFTHSGWLSYSGLLYAFGVVPFFELFFKADSQNLTQAEREIVSKDKIYDLLLYLMVPVQWLLLACFLYNFEFREITMFTKVGMIFSMGMLCGVVGINVAHEFGHRPKKHEVFFAKCLLLTSLYLHFYIEHNHGHHKHVGTDQDPATARHGEGLYRFWLRSLFFSYLGAWKIESKRLKRKKKSPISIHNQMVRFTLTQVLLVLVIVALFSIETLIAFMLSALIGMLLLETVNYIEHYGLRRNKVNEHRYEDVQPQHSWNSNHVLGRLVLFELSRHSDHHYRAAKPFQELDNWADSPQMPTGYPGMMLVALVPPFWFKVMNKKLLEEKSQLAMDS
jgi:alkane 1-monooxygenase